MTELIERHRDELHAHCQRILRSPHDAEDALQEAFVRAWRALHQYDGRGSRRAWLYRIATNASLDQIRGRRELAMEGAPAERVEPVDHFERRESLERVVRAAGRLPARQREVLVLRVVIGFSARETASSLGLTQAAVNSALHRARGAVRAELSAAEHVPSEAI
jgi:RNA polymerase sigma-70 factor (ECF subfamily)